jgi:ankyrin repeat protein
MNYFDAIFPLLLVLLMVTPQWGNTQLHYSASKGDFTATKKLLIAGADVDTTSNDGSTALHCAAARNHSATVSLLLAWNASLTIVDKVC